MPRKYEQVTDKIFQNLKPYAEVFDRVFYQEVRWWRCQFLDCRWNDCKFRRVSFAQNTAFSGCTFQDCQFLAEHTYLGGPSRFEDCEFIDCDFKNVQFWNAEFVRCTFTGSFTNLVFYGPEAPEGWETLLSNVDLSGVRMVDTDFRTGIDLSSTRMPNV